MNAGACAQQPHCWHSERSKADQTMIPPKRPWGVPKALKFGQVKQQLSGESLICAAGSRAVPAIRAWSCWTRRVGLSRTGSPSGRPPSMWAAIIDRSRHLGRCEHSSGKSQRRIAERKQRNCSRHQKANPSDIGGSWEAHDAPHLTISVAVVTAKSRQAIVGGLGP